MRFPVPDRLNIHHVALFATLVFLAQELEGTEFVFAVLTAVYTFTWAAAFNISGGIRYPSGAFIFFNGFLNVVLGLTFKVFLGQPGDRNLQAPVVTLFVYCVGMASMLVAVLVARGLRTRRKLLGDLDSLEDYKKAAIVCLAIGTIVSVMTLGAGATTNPVLSGLRQINKMPQMAIMLATLYEIRRSNGKRSFNWVVFAGIGLIFALGLASFGKEGMLLGFVAYFLAAVIEGYNFRKLQLVAGLMGFAFFTYYLVPYSQYVRGYGATTAGGNAAVATQYLGNLNETRRLYEETISDFEVKDEPHLYDQREGFMDRLIVFAQDDALIAYTEKGNVFGLAPTFAAYGNAVPRVLWHDKPTYKAGNLYAHEIGELAEEDTTTGVSFSATADAYHQAKWLGVLLLLPIDLFLYFVITDSVVGSAQSAPWALIPILDMTEIASQGSLDGPIYLFTYGICAIAFMVFLVTRVAPFLIRFIGRSQFQPLDASAPPSRSIPATQPKSITH